ncbi:hypothetical protein [Mucilaginibacter pocheonensis]|uniref:Membrane protein YphA (DoxX/SURF4 family) n=1 Tax=Mucilaginibacter pocheonensis TaxID=398050 RepID=A0ABU1TDU1_9SPHI|nr:hypothetical protein [Mucilaginibacter pocheonensis]MDR6943532.1 putative membrane protein YphA (DoxX/SURF4 family) [Mucilaginibacter pocheonensis]
MLRITTDQKIYFALRLACAMCFIGHGAFGIITKQIWCNYFAVMGIGQNEAYRLMPVVGIVDILMGISMLVYPTRIIAAWLVIWGLITASFRPISGEPFAELIERAGNFGAPFVLLLVQGGFKIPIKQWFVRMNDNPAISASALKTIINCLRVFSFLLLAGHGCLNFMEKVSLVNQYRSMGFHDPGKTAQIVGVFEIMAALLVLMRPFKNLLLVFIIWKITSELFYPHYEVFEWIERGGSYGVLLALWFAVKKVPSGFMISPFKNTNKLRVS